MDQARQWFHLMVKHVPKNRTEHGRFRKGVCEVTLGLKTNCGVYWQLSPCAAPDCECRQLDALVEQEEAQDLADPSPYLHQLAAKGYTFSGWIGQPAQSAECACADRTSELIIYSFSF